ncbi:MAG: hypothetical protein RML93_05670 [Anaerolineales bacterium]|nr:hypothetical protein [Anaerolineales bacterium]MDW8446764.1 hypothetical protein [Anaerolineales bacterium]
MLNPPRKLTFQEAWDTMTIFFVDEELEDEIDHQAEYYLELASRFGSSDGIQFNVADLMAFLKEEPNGLEFILREIELSEEKFLRIVSLLRKIGRIPGGFDVEWSIEKIKRYIRQDATIAAQIAKLLLEGYQDLELSQYIPRYYLETLNLREIFRDSYKARRIRYKRSLIGTYSSRKGHRVEGLVEAKLLSFRDKFQVGFEKGRSRLVETDIDFAIPSLNDPWVILMCSFQETTSSAQSTKARDMLAAYERVHRSNVRYNEKRIFINFVDGGGWLARKRDLERLVENCHYFLNIKTLAMLESILLEHLPKSLFS